MALADGSLVRASRTENTDLFSGAMGGYGLIGLITELEVEAVPNQRLEPRFQTMPAADFAAAFAAVADGSVPIAYGRLNIDREGFFDDAMLMTYRPVAGEIPPRQWIRPPAYRLTRDLSGAAGRPMGKTPPLRIETGIGAMLAGAASRSSLMNEPVITLDDRDPTRTDILHEYFVAPDLFADFTAAAKEIIPGSCQELLNIILRRVSSSSWASSPPSPVSRRCAARKAPPSHMRRWSGGTGSRPKAAR